MKILLYSPVPSPIDKIKNKYRWRIIVKCKFDDTIINLMNDVQEEFFNTKKQESTRIIIDLNPNNMLWLWGDPEGREIWVIKNCSKFSYKMLKNIKKYKKI